MEIPLSKGGGALKINLIGLAVSTGFFHLSTSYSGHKMIYVASLFGTDGHAMHAGNALFSVGGADIGQGNSTNGTLLSTAATGNAAAGNGGF